MLISVPRDLVALQYCHYYEPSPDSMFSKTLSSPSSWVNKDLNSLYSWAGTKEREGVSGRERRSCYQGWNEEGKGSDRRD